jgi:hypothetical protein
MRRRGDRGMRSLLNSEYGMRIAESEMMDTGHGEKAMRRKTNAECNLGNEDWK